MECERFRDDQLDVLYGEADADAVRRVGEHHASCAACRQEMAALRRVRRDVQAWALPERFAPRRAAAARPAPWLAAAAAVVAALGAGLALFGYELRAEQGALALRRGHERAEVQALLARQESRHRAEMEALRQSLLRGHAMPAAAGEDVLRQMEQMVRLSEQRQDARLAARLAATTEEAETRRRYDMARVGAGLAYLEGRTGQDIVRTTELMGRVLQASQQK